MKHKSVCNSLLILILCAVSCAKERAVEKIDGLSEDRYQKKILLDEQRWKAQSTIIQTSSELGPAFVGASSNLRIGYFDFSRKKLQFYSSFSILESGFNDKLPEYINSWDIEHSSYRLAESGGKVTNREEEDPTLLWSEKTAFKIDWAAVAVDEWNFEPCWKKVDSEVVDGEQIYTPEHVSFVVESRYEMMANCASFAELKRRYNRGNFTWNMRVRYSFAPHIESTSYRKLEYANELDKKRSKYGYFETVVDQFKNESDRYEKSVFVSRFDPQKTHKIHFSPDFPTNYKWIFNHPEIGVIKRTNDVFEANGLKIRFEIIDDPKVLFGDVRKSFVYFGTGYSGNLLGWGPSFQHPLTGETLRSLSVIFPVGLENLARIYQDYSRNERDAFEDGQSSLIKSLEKILGKHGVGESPQQWLATSKGIKGDVVVQKEFKRMMSKNLFGYPGYSDAIGRQYEGKRPSQVLHDGFFEGLTSLEAMDFTRMPQTEKPIGRMLDYVDPRHAFEMKAILGELDENIENLRLGQLTNYSFLPQQETIYPLYEAVEGLSGEFLADKKLSDIVDGILYTTAIHEFGHNIGLRHNFYGSVDAENFSSTVDESGLPLVQKNRYNEPIQLTVDEQVMTLPIKENSSSVMDYIPGTEESQSAKDWKKYDQAALVYAYSDFKIDLAQVRPLNLDGKITFEPRSNPTTFLYCTDEHAALYNPLCNRHDVGSTPSEIAYYKILGYERTYKIKNFRYNRAYWDATNYPARSARSIANHFDLLHLYQKIASGWKFDIDPNLDLTAEGRAQIHTSVEKDARRAATLLAAFYFSVVQQTSVDRDIINVYDDFTGSLERVGILYDKLYAMIYLGNYFRLPITFNEDTPELSFLEFVDEGTELGSVVREIVRDTTVSNVELVQGFESFGRGLFLDTATNHRNINDDAKEKIGMRCYTETGLQKALGIDPRKFYPVLKGFYSTQPKDESELLPADFTDIANLAVVTLSDGSTEVGKGIYGVRDRYFHGRGKQVAAIVKIANRYYVASKEMNPYSFDFMVNEGDSDSGKRYILGIKRGFDFGRFGQEMDCMSAEEFNTVE